jgi:hypothetical protein
MAKGTAIKERINQIKKEYGNKSQIAELYFRNKYFLENLKRCSSTLTSATHWVSAASLKNIEYAQLDWHRFCWRWGISLKWDGKIESLATNIFDSPLLIPSEELPRGDDEPAAELQWETKDVMDIGGPFLRIFSWTTQKEIKEKLAVITKLQKSIFGFMPRIREKEFGQYLCWYDLRYDKERFGDLGYKAIADNWRKYRPDEKRYPSPKTIEKAVLRIKKYICGITPDFIGRVQTSRFKEGH